MPPSKRVRPSSTRSKTTRGRPKRRRSRPAFPHESESVVFLGLVPEEPAPLVDLTTAHQACPVPVPEQPPPDVTEQPDILPNLVPVAERDDPLDVQEPCSSGVSKGVVDQEPEPVSWECGVADQEAPEGEQPNESVSSSRDEEIFEFYK